MRVGALKIELFIPNAASLKDKRTVIKALKDRIRNNFNVSISEVGGHDKWQRALLGVCAVGADGAYVNGLMDKILDWLRRERQIEIINFELEIL